MAITNVFAVGPIVINSTNLVQVEDYTISTEIEQVLASASGEPVPSFEATLSVRPMVTFTTTQLGTLLGAVNPLTGLCFPTGDVTIYFTRKTKCAPRSSSSNHLAVTIASGIVVVNRISAAKTGSPAVAEVTIYAIDDGTNPILAFSDSEAMIANVQVQQLYTVGPANINGAAIPDVQSMSIDFAPQVALRMGSADEAPTFVGIETITPKIMLDTLDPTYLDTYGFAGTAQTSGATNIYFQKLAKLAKRVSNATAEHVKISLANAQGKINVDNARASGNNDATAQLVITPISGSSAILTISAASAIT